MAVVACHMKINESSIRTIIKKKRKFVKPLLQLYWKMLKFCTHCMIPFYLIVKMQDCCKKGIPIDSNLIQQTVKSLYVNLKQKQGEGSKVAEFSAIKG